MIKTRIGLLGIEETVTRPVLIAVTNDIKKLLSLQKDIYTTYDIKEKVTKEKNPLGAIKTNNTMHDESILIEYEEDSMDGNELSNRVNLPDSYPIYYDKDINSSIIPVYHHRKVVINFIYRNKSKSMISTIINKLRLHTSNDGMYLSHDLEYHYALPTFLLALLGHVNDLKNMRHASSDVLNLDTYVNNTFDNRIDFANPLDGDSNKTDVVIREAQLEVNGYIVDDLHNIKLEQDETNGSWSIVFSYEFMYEKPVALLISYPLLVYNTMIHKKYRNFIKEPQKNTNAIRTMGSRDIHALTKRTSVLGSRNHSDYLRIPDIDKAELTPASNSTLRMFSVVTIVDADKPYELFNLADIPKIKFKDSVLDFLLTSEAPYVGDLYKSMFIIELYKENRKDHNNKVILDHSGNLTTTLPMDIKNTYRVVFSILNDLDKLEPASNKRIKNFIRSEIERLVNERTEPNPSFSKSRMKDTNLELDPVGLVVKQRESIIDSYLTLLDVTDETLYNTLSPNIKTEDIVFKVSSHLHSNTIRTKQTSMVLAGVLDEK